MTRHEDQKFLPYSADQIFDLVADIAKYPEFLPWCAGARIRSEEDISEKVKRVEADLIIAFAAFREKFGSDVILDKAKNTIEVNYLDGPFRKLVNHWQFEPKDDGCEVTFFVEFEFKSKILQTVIGQVFDQAMRRIVSAFEARAEALYG